MLDVLSERLAKASSIDEKLSLLEELPQVQAFLKAHPAFHSFSFTSQEELLVFREVIAIGQAARVFHGMEEVRTDQELLRSLLAKLIAIDQFYREMGGIVGYQATILRLLQEATETPPPTIDYHSPVFIDIAEDSSSVQEAVLWGLEALSQIAEIYPLGGAADRLHLVEEKTGMELPAAKLPFAGKTLLEHLIRDLQAREYLYFQRRGVQLTTPLAIMTSHEKNNHTYVTQICEEFQFFGRPKDSIRLFSQPLVPAVNAQGNWCMAGLFTPLLKPGGHGAIWKLARDHGIFDWLEQLGRKKGLIRQINNPIAGLDYGLLAFTGIGCKKEMLFGFASCPRLLRAAEGINVLIEREEQIVLTNIEYCDFAKFGIEDKPLKEGEPYSRFSANTNILFADLKAIAAAVDRYPFPGLLINLKKVAYTTEDSEIKEEAIARLESTMQNIADVFVETKEAELQTKHTFVTYNRRHKTISSAKKAFIPGKPSQETPEHCFYDLLTAHRELLIECGFHLPAHRTFEEYLHKGPECLFLYHPSLGPLYSMIRKKMCDGLLEMGSELILEIAELSANNLHVQGSLQIIAEQPMGHFDRQGILHFSEQIGRCTLENVKIQNRGVNWRQSQSFWKMDLQRDESVKIILKGQSQFIARNIQIKGNHTFIVEDGQMLQLEGGRSLP